MNDAVKETDSPEGDSPAALSHLDGSGAAHMVDVGHKAQTHRRAIAEAVVSLSAEAFEALTLGNNKKGDVLAVARIAGIQAAKQTSQLMSKVALELELSEQAKHVVITASCETTSVTGVEMEALTAASVAALTVYDMCKAVDKGIVIERVQLLEKQGGKSGEWKR